MWQQAAPENGPRIMQVYRAAASDQLGTESLGKIGAGLFSGAACCQPIELPHYKAAPLQALGVRRYEVFIRALTLPPIPFLLW